MTLLDPQGTIVGIYRQSYWMAWIK